MSRFVERNGLLPVAWRRVIATIEGRHDFRLRGALRLAGSLYLCEYVARMACLDAQVRWTPRLSRRGRERLTVVVTTFHRFENLRPIVMSALHLAFVDRIVAVNGNPDIHVAEWLPTDNRVVGIDAPNTGVGVRFAIADRFDAEYYLTVDDDMILRPGQLARLFDALVRHPETTHGILGERYIGDEAPRFEHGIRGCEATVDILNGVHAFTREHLKQYHRRLIELGLPSTEHIYNGEDIVLGASTGERPRVHDVGRWVICPSTIHPATALHYRRPGFHDERLNLFRRTRAVARRG